MKPFGIVYMVTNTVNGMRYIGSTKITLGRRWSRSVAHARYGRKSPLCAAIREFGTDVFTRVVLEHGSNRDELNRLEREKIAEYGTLWPNGYNLQSGGTYGYRMSPVTLQTRRVGTFERDAAFRARLSAACKGHGKGKVLSEAQKKAVSDAHRGKPKSPEQRAKMSLAAKNASAETRARRTEAIRAAFARERDAIPKEK